VQVPATRSWRGDARSSAMPRSGPGQPFGSCQEPDGPAQELQAPGGPTQVGDRAGGSPLTIEPAELALDPGEVAVIWVSANVADQQDNQRYSRRLRIWSANRDELWLGLSFVVTTPALTTPLADFHRAASRSCGPRMVSPLLLRSAAGSLRRLARGVAGCTASGDGHGWRGAARLAAQRSVRPARQGGGRCAGLMEAPRADDHQSSLALGDVASNLLAIERFLAMEV
jgi:hypothetical protein